MFSFLAGPIWGSILVPFFGSCRGPELVSEVLKKGPLALHGNARRGQKKQPRRPGNRGRSICANLAIPDDVVAEALNNKKLGSSRTRLRMHDYDYDYDYDHEYEYDYV